MSASEETEGRQAKRPEGLLDGLINHHAGGRVAAELELRVKTELLQQLQGDRGEFFARDMEALWRMLEIVIALAGDDRGGERDEVQLLNLACGRCEEGEVLSAFFGRGERKVHQFALDLREREICQGKRRYQATERLFDAVGVPRVVASEAKTSTIEFIADDATRLVGYGQIPESFDVIFVRHQNLWFDRVVWQRIYDFALDRIAGGGVLVITSYFDREHLEALAVLRALGGVVLATRQNPWSRKLSYPGKTVDRHVAVIAPGGKSGGVFIDGEKGGARLG